MGLAFPGITHCNECGTTLSFNETYICNMCKRKEERKIKSRERTLNILENMSDYEIKALEKFIHKIGKEYKNKEIKKEIKKLEESLEEDKEREEK